MKRHEGLAVPPHCRITQHAGRCRECGEPGEHLKGFHLFCAKCCPACLERQRIQAKGRTSRRGRVGEG